MIKYIPDTFWKIIVYAVGTFLMASCGNDQEQIDALQAQLKADSLQVATLNRQMNAINEALDSADILGAVLRESNRIDKQTASAKIREIDSLLEVTLSEVGAMELAKYGQSPIRALVEETVRQKEALAKEKRAYYQNLQQQIDDLSVAVVDMGRIVEQKNKELLAKDNIILRIKEERRKQEAELAAINQRLNATKMLVDRANSSIEQSRKDLKAQKAKILFESGMSMKNEFLELDKKAIAIGTKNVKKSLLEQALKYFEEAYAMGYPDAQRQILLIKTEKQYAKFLKD